MRFTLTVLIFAIALIGFRQAHAADIPKFGQYKAERTYSGPAAKPKLDTPCSARASTMVCAAGSPILRANGSLSPGDAGHPAPQALS